MSVQRVGRPVDLVQIGRRAINYLTRIAPAEEGYIPYFGAKAPWHDVPYLIHCPWDYADGVGRLLEALAFVRRMTGSDAGIEAEEGMIRTLVTFYGEDGVPYRRPNAWTNHEAGSFEFRSGMLALVALIENGRTDLEPVLNRALKGMQLVYSPKNLPKAAGCWDGKQWNGVEVGVGVPSIDALARCYELTGDEGARTLMEQMVEHYFFGPDRLYAEDGSFLFPEKSRRPEPVPGKNMLDYEPSVGHFHTRTCGTTGLARVGRLTGNERYLSQARKIHDHILGYGTQFGWYPENLFTDGIEVSEQCDTLDMIELQILLAETGQTELYDLSERYVKNHVAVSQFEADESVRAIVSPTPEGIQDPEGRCCYHDVLERMGGGFVCVTYPDDLYTAYPGSRRDSDASYLIDVSGCCSGSGAKSAYVAWRDSVRETDDAIRIQMAISREHPAVSVQCEEGELCRMTLQPRTVKPLAVRLADWTDPNEIKVQVDGAPVPNRIEKGYLHLTGTAGKAIELTLPMKEAETIEEVSRQRYRVTWRGALVTGVQCIDGENPKRHPYTDGFIVE